MVELVGIYSNKSRTHQQIRDLLLLIPQGRPSSPQPPRRRQVRLRKDQLEPLLADYQAGASIKDLAKSYGVSTHAVMDHVQRAGLPKRYPRLSSEAIDQAIRMYVEGKSLMDSAKVLKVAPGTISLALKRAGVSLRPRRGR